MWHLSCYSKKFAKVHVFLTQAKTATPTCARHMANTLYLALDESGEQKKNVYGCGTVCVRVSVCARANVHMVFQKVMSWGARWSPADAHPVASGNGCCKPSLHYFTHTHTHTTRWSVIPLPPVGMQTNLCMQTNGKIIVRHLLTHVHVFSTHHKATERQQQQQQQRKLNKKRKQGRDDVLIQQRSNLALTNAVDQDGAWQQFLSNEYLCNSWGRTALCLHPHCN